MSPSTLELTSFQKEVWLAQQGLPEGHPGISACGRFLLQGHMDENIVRQSLQRLVDHYPLLTASLVQSKGYPLFMLNAHKEVDFTYYDVQTHENPQAEAHRICQECAETPFIPLGGKLIRFILVRFAEQKYYFLNQSFHLVNDGIFNNAAAHLLSIIYEDILANRPTEWPKLPSWQLTIDADKAHLNSARCERDKEFWLQSVQNAPDIRVFPSLTQNSDTFNQTSLYAHKLSPKSVAHFQSLLAEGSGMGALLTSIHAITLHLMYDANVPVNMTINNGERKNPMKMQGYMMNIIPIVPNIHGDASLSEIQKNITEQSYKIRKHAKTSITLALREARILKDFLHLWDTTINFVPSFAFKNSHFHVEKIVPFFPSIDAALLYIHATQDTENSPLDLYIQYSQNHFTLDDVKRYALRFEKVLTLLASQGHKTLKECSVLLDDEYEQLKIWEQGKKVQRPQLSIPALFTQVAKQYAQNPAIRSVKGDSINYAKLLENVQAFAHHLLTYNIAPGQVVAVLARRHHMLPECILGIMHIGAIYLPIDPDYPLERITHMFEDAKACCIVALHEEDFEISGVTNLLANLPANLKPHCPKILWDAKQQKNAPCKAIDCKEPKANDAAYLIYTSGSTGNPKGVLVGHKSFVNMILCQVEIMGVRPSDHALHFASTSFDASMAEIFLPLMAGACLYPVPRELIDIPLNLHKYLTDNAITVATFPPSYLALFNGKPFPSLRVLLTAGEPPVSKDAKHYAKEFEYYNAYGPTEFSVCASMYRISPADKAYNSIGRPIANTAAHILDSHGRRVAPGMVGELWLSGKGLALGYYDKPDITAKAFCKPQALPTTLCYRTGDRAAWNAEGNLIILGRSDSQVKIHGHRIELLEITRILEKHNSISQAIVLLIKKQDASTLEAFVVLNSLGAKLEADALKSELLAWVRAHLPSFACPNFFHILNSLPIAPTGKVDRKALENKAINKNPQQQLALSGFESTLVKIFSEFLGYEVQNPHQDFFALGGDSFKAMQLVQKLHSIPEMQTIQPMSMRDFLNNSSVAALSDFIKRHQMPENSLEKTLPKSLKNAHDPIACTSAQLALWAQELTHPNTDRYHMPCMVSIDGTEQDIAKFIEAMRTALGNQPLCTSSVHGPIEAPHFMPFSQEIPACEQLKADSASQYQAFMERIIHRPFRFRDESLVRLALIQKNYPAAKQKVFVMVLHHIIADAASLDALWQEALRLLKQQPHILPNLKQVRADLLRHAALDEQVFLHSTTRQEEVSFWKERLFPIPKPLSKALTNTQEEHPSGRLAFTLNGLVSQRMQELARQNSTGLLSIVIALLGDFLCTTAKQNQCFLTIPMGTREHANLEHVCGYFTNPMPLRLKPEQGLLSENIHQAKNALYGALGHNKLPIHELAKDLRLSTDNHAALSDVFVTHIHLSLPNVDFPLDIELISPLEDNVYLHALKAPLSFMLVSKNERQSELLGEQMGLVLEYAQDIFSKEQAQDFMQACMRHMLKSIDCTREHFEIKDLSCKVTPKTSKASSTNACCAETLSSIVTQPSHENTATQELSKAWEKVLGQTPKDADNFFLHGGDSIKAIQFIGHLHRAGYTHMAPAHCYDYPTYAALLTHISTAQATTPLPKALASPLEYAESIALPPFHRQWVLRHPLSWPDFHMALPLLFTAPIDLPRFKHALTNLAQRHEALCLRLQKNTAGEVHFIYEQAKPPLWLELEHKEHSLAQCFAMASKELFAQLSQAKDHGPLYACAVFTHEGKQYALLGLHHFCVDIFSFEIIKADLFALYTHTEQNISSIGAASYAKLVQGVEGQKVPSVFTSEQDYLDELHLWHTEIEICKPEKFCPVEHEDITPPQRKQLSHTVESFSYDTSRRGGGLPEILAGLSMALADMHEAPLLLTLEGHGREQILPHIDISHTVAWFTSAFPLAIKPHVEYEQLDNLPKLWANKLDSLPMRGARFAFAAMNDALLNSYVPHISLNYIGNMQSSGQKTAQDTDWQSLRQFASPSALPGLIGKHFVSDCPVEITILLNDNNTLTIDASYDSQKCAVSWLEELVQAWGKAITELSKIYRAGIIHIDNELAALCQCEPDDILTVSHPVQAEEVMLFQHLLDKESHDSIAHYMVQICFNLRPEQMAGQKAGQSSEHSPIQVHILEQAWHELCLRHEALRMLFPRKESFIRAVLKEPRYYAECVDLSNLPLDQQSKKQDALLQQLRSTPFDFNCGPLLYLSLITRKDAKGSYVVMAWTFSHVLMDGWCIGIMIHELQELYAALLEHRAPNLPSAPSLSEIYAELGQSSIESLKIFWSKALEGFNGTTSLVQILDKRLRKHHTILGQAATVPDIQGIKYTEDVVQEYSFALEQSELELLHQAAASYSVSLAQLLQSLWGILLSDAHNKDVVFGVVFAARPAHIQGIENTLGLFLRTLPVRVRWHEDMLFKDLAIHIRKNAVQLGTHERDMLSDIQNCRPSGGALFDHSLTFENYPLDFLRGNNRLGFDEVDGFERAPYPLTLSVYTTKQSCNMRFVYNTDHIHCEQFNLLMHQWQNLLHSFTHTIKAHKAQSLLCKELCPAYEPNTSKLTTSEIIPKITQEDTSFFTQNTLQEIFLKQVELYPIEPAYMSAQNDVWSYSELAIAARRIAAGLKDILPHEPIAIAIPRGPENMAAILGVLMAGGCYLSLDEHAPLARQQSMLNTAKCRHIIFHHNVDNALYGQDFSYSCLKFDELMLNKPLPLEQVKKDGGESIACMMFTSGTTGTPKGIILPHQGILRLVCQSNICDIKPQERVGQTSSFAFDASNFEIWGALLHGGTLCGLELDTLTSTSLLKKELEQKNISTIFLTTGLLSSLSAVDPSVFASIDKLYTGGETLNTKLTKDVLTACPKLQLYNGYGPTENSTYSIGHWVRLEDVQDPTKAVPIGLPLNHTRVYIIDAHDNLVQDGQWGEICVAGLGLALGYYNKPEASQKAFVMLKSVGEKVYRTGDIGRMGPEGFYEFAGRRDNQIKIRGFRVELDEIEQAFLQLKGVKQAAILVRGEHEHKKLVAFVMGKDIPSQDLLYEELGHVLPEYMLPTKILALEHFPLTSNAKLDRTALLKMLDDDMTHSMEHAKIQDISMAHGESLEPEHAEQVHAAYIEHIGKIFSTVLQIPWQKIARQMQQQGAEVDFFHLGGQSLKAIHLLGHLQKAFGLELRLSDIMQLRTIANIAKHISTLKAHNNTQEEQFQTVSTPDLPLLSEQKNFWFLHHLMGQSSKLNIVSPLHINNLLNIKVLNLALRLVEMRHEALRVRFSGRNELQEKTEPRQWISSSSSLQVKVQDLRLNTVPDADMAKSLYEAIEADYHTPFIFEHDASLIRAYYYIESDTSSVLSLVAHHIICDGWSMNLILNDIHLAYTAILAAMQKQEMTFENIPLSELSLWAKNIWPSSPPSYAHILNKRLRNTQEAMLQRLIHRFTPLPEPLMLPTDFVRKAAQSFESTTYMLSIPHSLRNQLHSKAKAYGVPVFAVLLAMTEIFLFKHSKQKDFVLGIPVACRDHLDAQETVGLLMNVMPLRLQLDVEDSFKTCALKCAEVFGQSLQDAEYPFNELLQHLNVPREDGHSPLYDMVLSYEEQEWKEFPNFCGQAAKIYELNVNNNRLDITLNVINMTDSLQFHWQYKDAIFTKASIERMAKRFITLLEKLCTDCADTLPVSTLDILPTEEKSLLTSFNNTHAAFDNFDVTKGIYDQFAHQASLTPHAAALRHAHGSINYADFAIQVEKLAAWLHAQNITAGTAVGIALPRSLDMMLAIYATLRLGAYYVPLITSDTDFPKERVSFMLQDLPSGSYILSTAKLAPKLASIADLAQEATLLTMPHMASLDVTSTAPMAEQNLQDLAYIIFTSGSTGRPKGVMLESQGVLNRIFWMQDVFKLGTQDVILQKTPISFDVSVWELFWWAWTGASLALLEPDEERYPDAIVEAIWRHKVTTIHFVPSMLHIFLEHCQNVPQSIERIASLKRVFVSGEAINYDCVQLFNKLLFESNGTELHNLYGPTEATVDVTWQPCSPFVVNADTPVGTQPQGTPNQGMPPVPPVPIGKAISNTQIDIVDDFDQICPIGVPGELIISGIQVARGYANRPDLTEQAFFDNLTNKQRSYRTGDLARYTAQGHIEYLGRKDHQVKMRGFRIELGEIEAALESHARINKAVVRLGTLGNMPSLEAFILPQENVGQHSGQHSEQRGGETQLTVQELRQHLQGLLPTYMCPSSFFIMPAMELSAHGKLDRKNLQGTRLNALGNTQPKEEPAKNKTQAYDNIELNQVEKAVRQCWYEVLPELKEQASSLANTVSFFEAGGSSLLLIRLFELLNARWPNIFQMAELFVCINIQEQAQKIYTSLQPAQQESKKNGEQEFAQNSTQNIGQNIGQPTGNKDIAIIGLALRLADYTDEESFWSDLITQSDRVCALSPAREREQRAMLSAAGVSHEGLPFQHAAYLDDISSFDPQRFAMSPSEARIVDPEHRLFFATALRALENAGYGGHALRAKDVGVFVGASAHSSFRQAVAFGVPEQAEQSAMINIPSALTARLSYLYNWTGPAAVLDTACSSGLVALHHACMALQNGDCSVALCGAVRVEDGLLLLPHKFAIVSNNQRTYSFEARASGTTGGEGAIVFLLKPLKQALQDNDSIHAIIKGSAVNQDGQGTSLVAPNPVAQANVIAKAAQQVVPSAQFAETTNFSLDQLSFVEAHGTGTVLGDPAEVEGLRRAFASNPSNAPKTSIPISSVKGNFGHLDAAAGSLGLLKAVLSLKHALLPGQAHFEKPNPHIDFTKAHVHVPAKAEKLSRVHGSLKAGISSFGLSGINAHVILEEAPKTESAHYAPAYYCIALSAASMESLHSYAKAMLISLEKSPKHIQDIAATLTLGRTHLAIRIAFVANDTKTLCKKLLHWLCTPDFIPENSKEKLTATHVYVYHEDETKAHAAAMAFMQGATPLWADATCEHAEHTHIRQSFRRVHLPAVPMERITCWPSFANTLPKKSTQHTTKLPDFANFMGHAIHTPHGQHYALDVENKAFWPLHEHKVLHRPTLVGMAFPALIANIMQGKNPTYTALQIHNIVWHAPLLAEKYTHISLQIASHKQGHDETQSISLMGQADHTWTNFVEANVHRISKSHGMDPIDIENIHQDMLKQDLAEFSNPVSKNSVLEVSGRWHCRTALWRSPDGAVTVSRIALKPEYMDDLQSFSLHPAMLDIATSSAFEATASLLPAACKSISIYHPLPAQIWVRCHKKSTPQSERNLIIDCNIYDDDGHVLVHFEDLVFLPLRENKALLHKLDWKHQPSPMAQAQTWAQAQTQTNTTLLLDNAPSNIMQELENLGHTVKRMPYPHDEKTCKELIEKLQHGNISHIFALLPQDISPWQGILPLRHILQNMSLLSTPIYWLYLAKQYKPEHAAIRGAFMALCQEDTRLRGIFVEAESSSLSKVSIKNINDYVFPPPQDILVTWLRLDAQGKLLSPSLSKALSPATKPISSTNKCIVITGGLGSLALSMAAELVPALGSTLVLLHKSPFSLDGNALDTSLLSESKHDNTMQERVEALSNLHKQGIAYKLYQCDVTHAKELEACLEKVRADCGPIGSIIHTAGLAGAGFMLQKDQSTFESVLHVKLHAARLLYEFTKQDPIEYFILASSRTGLMGAAGQSDYTAANAALDALAHELRQYDYPAFSIAWNTLAEVGMAARAGIHEAHMLHPKLAAKTLLEALALNEAHIVLSLAGEFLDGQGINTGLNAGLNTVHAGHLNNTPQDSITEGLENLSIVDALCSIIQRVLGHEHVDSNDDFYALGGDSLSGMRIIAILNDYFNISLNLSDLLTNSGLADFSKYITDKTHDVKKHSTILSPTPFLEEYPVSREQQAVLLKEALTEDHTGYNLPSFFPLKDEYSKEHVQKALDALIRRHEILRTRFVHMAELSPRMRILDSVQCIIQEYQFDTLSDALSLVQAFDFEQGHLFRMAILHIARLPHTTNQDAVDQEHNTKSGKVLFFDLHHSLSDAKGLGILIYEFFALLRGESLSTVTKHMKDAAWQQHSNKDAEVTSREYWLKLFADAHDKHAQGRLKNTLPEDFARPAFYTFKGDNADFFIAAEESKAMQNFAKAHKITLNALIRSIWGLLIYADTKATDIALGLATDTRPAGFEHCVGMLACLLPTRIHMEPHQTLSQYVRTVQANDAMALEHAAFSEADVLSELRLPADPSRLGLSEIIISFMNYAAGESELAPYILPNHACSADLTIYISNKDGGLLFALQYYAEVFSKARMQALGERFIKLAQTLLASHAEDTLQDILTKSAVMDRQWEIKEPIKEQTKPAPHAASKPAQEADSAIKVLEVEQYILTIFHNYFGENSFGSEVSFFELGGHSLLAVQIVNAINKHYKSNLSARDVFSHPSPRLLAKQLVLTVEQSITQNSQQSIANQYEPLQGEYYPLSHAQQRLYVLHCMEEESTAYNMVFVFRVKNPLEKQALEKALQALSQRQDILRTIIVEKDGDIYQKVVPDLVNPCHEHIGTLPEDQACAWVSSMAIKPYDLSKNMLRICLCTTTEQEQYLAIGIHHILGDGWSMQIFARELMAFYVHEAHMPPLPLQYRDYALAQQHKTWQEEATWWKNELHNPPKPLNLPADAPSTNTHAHGIRHREDTQSRIVAAQTIQALRKLASQQQISLATYLLTLLSALLMRLARQDDIIIGMGVAGRDESNIEGLIGFFVNMLPIRIKAPEDGNLDTLLKAVQRSCGEALARASYPYDLLVRECVSHACENTSEKASGIHQEQLFNIVFEYQRYGDLQHNIPIHEADNFTPIQEDHWLPMLENSAKSARYPITFYAQDEPAGLRLRAQYDSELFSASSIANWLELWEEFMLKVVNQ